MAVATFAAGCFWGVQDAFSRVPGVRSTEAGYTGGHVAHPTYAQVCGSRTGHAEAVRVEYDPAAVSYEELLEVFFAIHDPTQVDRQGPDIGAQYRSAIFFHTPEQERAAREALARLAESGRLRRPPATQVVPAGEWWPAERYHQHYLRKQPHGTCGGAASGRP